MLRALQQAFVTAFATTFSLGSLVTFVVTMSGISLFNIHPAFWGLVFGYAVSRILERADHAKAGQCVPTPPGGFERVSVLEGKGPPVHYRLFDALPGTFRPAVERVVRLAGWRQ